MNEFITISGGYVATKHPLHLSGFISCFFSKLSLRTRLWALILLEGAGRNFK